MQHQRIHQFVFCYTIFFRESTGNDWKIPTLKEVIAMLALYHHNEIQQNAAAYLQHLSYSDDEVKSEVRKLGKSLEVTSSYEVET